MKITKQKLKQIIQEEKNWMQKAFGKNKGGLHRALGVPEDEDISVSKMADALRTGGKKEKMARAAVNANPDKYGSIKDVGIDKKNESFLTKEALSVMIQDILEEEKDWIQRVDKEIKKDGTKGVCTGEKFGGPTCRPGTPRYNLAKVFRNMNEVTAAAQKSAEYESLSALIQEAIEEYGYRGRPTKASKQKAKMRWNAKVAQLVKDQGGHIPMDMWTSDLAHAYNQRKKPEDAAEMVMRSQDNISETTMASGAVAGYAGSKPKKK